VSDRNEQLAEHNQKLRHEIEDIVRVALNVRKVANDLQPDAPILPQVIIQQAYAVHDASSAPANVDIGKGTLPLSSEASPADPFRASIDTPSQPDAAPEWAAAHGQSQEHAPSANRQAPASSKNDAEASQLDHMVAAAIARKFPKPKSADSYKPTLTSTNDGTGDHSVSIETLDGTVTLKLPTPTHTLTTEQQHSATAHSSSPNSKRPPLGGWWLTIIVIFVVLSAFSAGFMAMILLQQQRTTSPSN
jgi:hypothetical protein